MAEQLHVEVEIVSLRIRDERFTRRLLGVGRTYGMNTVDCVRR